MKIYTITLNPAYDIHASAESLSLDHENLAEVKSRDAGGKGINISRALTYNGVENTAIVVLGKDNCTEFEDSLTADNITYVGIKKPGRIRENLTVHTESGETRISFGGFTLDNSVLTEISSEICADRETIVTFTGSVPKGVDMTEIKHLLISLKSKGAKIVIDSRSFTLSDLSDVKPWLIKPNSEEIAEYSGKTVNDFSDCLEFARKMNREGIENVMISLGEKGAMLVTNATVATATPPRISVLSTIGAGDSTIAGFIAAYAQGNTPEECLRMGVSFGTAACLLEGTTPPTRKNVAQIYQNTHVKNL